MLSMRKLSFGVLLAFAFSIPIEDSVQFGIGRLSKVVGLLAVGAWILAKASEGRLRRLPAAFWAAPAFVAWSLLSYYWSPQPAASLSKAATLVQMLGVVWLIWDQTSSQHDLVVVMRAFLLGSCAASVATFLAAGAGEAYSGTRYSSANSGPDNTGALLAVAVVMACYLWRADTNARWRGFYALFLPVATVALLFTATRAAAIAVALGLAIVVFDRRYFTIRRLLAVGAVGVAVFVVAMAFLPSRSVDRLGTTQDEIASGTLNGRTTYWRMGFDLFSQHPIQGVGLGAFADENVLIGGEGRPAHNVFVSVMVETGILGLSLFVTALALAALGLRPVRPDLRRMWMGIGAAWLVGASSLTWETRKITWFVFALALVQAGVSQGGRRQHGSVSLDGVGEEVSLRRGRRATLVPLHLQSHP